MSNKPFVDEELKELLRIAQILDEKRVVNLVATEKIDLGPDQFLVVKLTGKLTPAQMRRATKVFGEVFGPERSKRVLFTNDNIEFQQISMADAEGKITNGST